MRLQQTLRILAETAETPEPVRVEATAREVASQQRILHEHEEAARLAAEAAEHLAIAERRAAEEAREAARELAAAAQSTVTEPIATIPATVHRRLGPGRAGRRDGDGCRASAPLAAPAPCALLARCCSPPCSRWSAGSWPPRSAPRCSSRAAGPSAWSSRSPGSCASPACACRRWRLRPSPSPESTPFEPIELAEPEVDEHGWMPQPLPKPLHLSRGTIAAMAMASIEAAAEFKRAAADAEVARRVEQLEPEVPSIAPAPAPAAATAASDRRATEPANPMRAWGSSTTRSPAFDDLDAVLRRRRQAG